MYKEHAVVEAKLDGITERLDRMEPKLDKVVSKFGSVEEMATNNKATIKVILVSILGALVSGGLVILRITLGN